MMTAAYNFSALSLDEAVQILQSAPSVLIFIHQNPDGDAVGSAFALAQILRSAGKHAHVVCADEIPPRLAFLLRGQDSCTYTEGMEQEYSLLCAVDTASPAQLGKLQFLSDSMQLSIDHHGMNEPFCKNFTDPGASAAGELIFTVYRRFLESGCIRPSADICRLLYAAIVSDTGSFKFSNTTKQTFLIAAELTDEISSAADGGDDTAMLCHRLFECRTLSELYAQRAGIDALKLTRGGALGIVLFTRKTLEENGITDADIANAVSIPRGVAGVKISLSVKQSPDDPTLWRVSSRASCDIDVASICAQFGGGGHRRAAGCVITAPDADSAFAVVSEAFGQALDAAAQEDSL